MKILLVEDEPKLASFMEKGLSDEGHAVTACDNGSKGSELAATEDFDLILLDIMLPGQDGFEILKNLRNFKVETPVIFVSALNESQHVINGLDLVGCASHMTHDRLSRQLLMPKEKKGGEEETNGGTVDMTYIPTRRQCFRSSVSAKLLP